MSPVRIEYDQYWREEIHGVAEAPDGFEARLKTLEGDITAVSHVGKRPRRGLLGKLGLTEEVAEVQTRFPGDGKPIVSVVRGGSRVRVREEEVTLGESDAYILKYGYVNVFYIPFVPPASDDTHD